MKLKLENIHTDSEILALRPVNPLFVSRYRQSMRNGDKFPPIIIDQDGAIIAGNHRYYAYLEEYGESHTIEVTRKRFKSEAERIEEAVRDNARHGNPLDGISRKRAILKLSELGRDSEAIARLLGISAKRVEDLAGMAVMVIGGKGEKSSAQPVKRGLEHMAGKTVTSEQYESHRERDRGVPARQSAEQLTRWIINGWVDMTDEPTARAIEELSAVIKNTLFAK